MLNNRNSFHIVLNVVSLILPMIAAIGVLPGLLDRLGVERFGLLSLTWALVGYFGMLDLGLGRALTQYLARCSAAKTPRGHQAALACDARWIMLGLGVGWTLVILALTPWLATWFHVSTILQTEALLVWPMVAVSVPLLMWTSCSIGVLEARSKFVAVNSVRVPLGLATFLVPWLVSFYTPDLRVAMAGMLVVRLTGAAVLAMLARHEFASPSIERPAGGLQALLQFGGWLTVSNAVGPAMMYFDRFAIAAMISVAAVAAYTVPHDILTRLPTVPMAMMGVLFPLLAQAGTPSAEADDQLHALVSAAARLLAIFWLPAMSLAFWLGPPLLTWWVGGEVAKASQPIWRWLAAGVLINGLAHLPFTLLQSKGRTDLIAKLHAAELLPYCALLAVCLTQFGVIGAAIAWTLRVAVDTALLHWFAAAHFPLAASVLKRSFLLGTSVSLALGLTGAFI